MRFFTLKKLLALVATGSSGVYFFLYNNRTLERSKVAIGDTRNHQCYKAERDCMFYSRENTIENLSSSESSTTVYDIAVIGGGSTGAGVALDAVTRGLKVILIERGDYGCGTSSKSTKLIHGGVRYLQKALLQFDYKQYEMLKEALSERANLIRLAPHLAQPLPILLPLYKRWQIPYFWLGFKVYDFIAGRKQVLVPSHFVSRSVIMEMFPNIKSDRLVGGVIYYDGQHNDSMMNLSLIMSAIELGADCLNYVEAVKIEEKEEGTEDVSRIECRDLLQSQAKSSTFHVNCKCIVNATGPFTDSVRKKLYDDKLENICVPSSGAHISLPLAFGSSQVGLLDACSSDGRVIFALPWQSHIIAGTTDEPFDDIEKGSTPSATEQQIDFILNELQKYSRVKIKRSDVLSAWSGIRPLVRDPNTKGSTKDLARNHIIEVSRKVGKVPLITIAGGKWTTYRKMAQDTVDVAVKECNIKAKNDCKTDVLCLIGGAAASNSAIIDERSEIFDGLEADIAHHLYHTYGSKSKIVLDLCDFIGSKRTPIRMDASLPYVDGEVRYAVRQQARHVSDVIGYRMRIAFLDARKAKKCIEKVADIMADELSWTDERKRNEIRDANTFLSNDMGLKILLDPTTLIQQKQQVEGGLAAKRDLSSAVDQLSSQLCAGKFKEEIRKVLVRCSSQPGKPIEHVTGSQYLLAQSMIIEDDDGICGGKVKQS